MGSLLLTAQDVSRMPTEVFDAWRTWLSEQGEPLRSDCFGMEAAGGLIVSFGYFQRRDGERFLTPGGGDVARGYMHFVEPSIRVPAEFLEYFRPGQT